MVNKPNPKHSYPTAGSDATTTSNASPGTSLDLTPEDNYSYLTPKTPKNSYSPGSKDHKSFVTQTRFLAAYRKRGTITSAAHTVGIARGTVNWWTDNDHLGFRERYRVAVEEFADYLEQMAIDKIALQGPKDNPLLHITLLNAHKPEKYRPRSAPANEIAKELMNEMKRIRAEEKAKLEAGEGRVLESGVVEGEVTG
jgi:hypothetical protein